MGDAKNSNQGISRLDAVLASPIEKPVSGGKCEVTVSRST